MHVRSQVSAARRGPQGGQPTVRIQDIRTLFRAQEIVSQLAVGGLEPAIDAARQLLLEAKTRWQYLQEMLPAHVAQTIPSERESFEVQCADFSRFVLRKGPLPLLRQIADLEREHYTQAIKVIHGGDGDRREYWL